MTFEAIRNWPKIAMVGYVDCLATGSAIEITHEQLARYNVVAFGFTNLDGTVHSEVHKRIVEIKAKQRYGTLNLISFGGAHARGNIPEETVANLLNVVKEHELDGVDLDIEDADLTAPRLLAFIEQLRDALSAEGYLLTAAPILAGTSTEASLHVPGGDNLDPIFNKIKFDAILVQAYNSGTQFCYPLPASPETKVNERSVNIISAAYAALTNKTHNPIHKDTKIVIGIPANPGGAPSASNCWNQEDYRSVPPLIQENINDIIDARYGMDSRQFGGLMMWSLNTDAAPQYFPGYEGMLNPPAGYFSEHVARLITA